MEQCKNIDRWYLIDATNKIVGRFASQIIKYLIGKHKRYYQPNIYPGDFIVIINSDKLLFSANKINSKIYYHHTGYVGGIKSITAKEQFIKDSRRILMSAIKGMLPKNRIGRKMATHLKIYKDNNHKHIAQKPIYLNIT